MTDARDSLLSKLAGPGNSSQAADARLHAHPRGPLPERGAVHHEQFTKQLCAVAGSYTQVPDHAQLPSAILDYLTRNTQTRKLTLAPHPLLETLTWPAEIRVEYGAAHADSTVTLSVAECGIAETGSLMLRSCAQTPTSLNFLADHFLCVLPVNAIVPHMEDAWDRWRRLPDPVPRVINFITGPSRTADVEQIIQLGAHGPRQLHVLLLEHE